MQSISQNAITQEQHGASKAVDYAATPDPTIYAPENGTIVSYGQQGAVGTVNDAGLALRMQGVSGLHQFAHTSQSLVNAGSKVLRGQPIAVMGYTGYTIPSGPKGAHCHWWIQNGTFIYPPSLINETFKKLGVDMATRQDIQSLWEMTLETTPTEQDYSYWGARPTSELIQALLTGDGRKKKRKSDVNWAFKLGWNRDANQQEYDFWTFRNISTLMAAIYKDPTSAVNQGVKPTELKKGIYEVK